MTEARSVTLADVASEAHVHAATVSRALTRPDVVAPATLARVRAAVDRLGYVPNLAARRLAGGAAGAIAVLVPDMTNPFFASVVRGAQAHARAEDRMVVLADTDRRAEDEIAVLDALSDRVDGVILCAPVAPGHRLVEAARRRPLVTVNRRIAGCSSVVVDQRAIVTLALEHLRTLGHRHVALVRGPTSFWSSRQRLDAVEAFQPGVEIVDHVAPTFEGGEAALELVLASGASAAAAFNDVQALGLLAAARTRGIDVPGRLDLVGSDGIPMTTMTTPSLTTVAAPQAELGRQAAVLTTRGPARHVTLTPTLVLGASTRERS